MDLVELSVKDWVVRLDVALWVLLVAGALIVLGLIIRRRWDGWRGLYLEVDEAEIGLGSQKVHLKANREDLQIAFEFWTELTTRKIGLPFDEDHDVVAEIYDSWYAFFTIARQLIKGIPASKVRHHASTRYLVDLTVKILNDGLRPHLTRWQARYRRWWVNACDDIENKELTPHEIQQTYEHYVELVDEMKVVNRYLRGYTKNLHDFVHQK